MTENQKTQLEKLYAYWQTRIKDNGSALWSSTAQTIANYLRSAIDGHMHIVDLQDTLADHADDTSVLGVLSWYRSAANDVQKIIDGKDL